MKNIPTPERPYIFLSFLAPEGTGGHLAPAGGGAPVQDTGVLFLKKVDYLLHFILHILHDRSFFVCETLFPGGVALLCSGGDLPLPGEGTTGDKMLAFQSHFENM